MMLGFGGDLRVHQQQQKWVNTMKKYFLFISMILLFAINCFSQIKYDYNKFPDSNDEKYFFDLLFHGNGS